MTDYTSYAPPLNSPANAVTLMRYGAAAAGLNAVAAAGIGVAAIYLGHPVLGLDGWCLADAAVFAVITWRVYCQSLPWAIAGLVLFAFEEIFKSVSHPDFMGNVAVIAGAILWGPCYVYAVRGGLYLREKKLVSEYATDAPALSREAYTDLEPAPPVPQGTQDENNEFLLYLRQKDRRYQRPGRTVQEEFSVWRADRAKKRAQEAQKQGVGSRA